MKILKAKRVLTYGLILYVILMVMGCLFADTVNVHISNLKTLQEKINNPETFSSGKRVVFTFDKDLDAKGSPISIKGGVTAPTQLVFIGKTPKVRLKNISFDFNNVKFPVSFRNLTCLNINGYFIHFKNSSNLTLNTCNFSNIAGSVLDSENSGNINILGCNFTNFRSAQGYNVCVGIRDSGNFSISDTNFSNANFPNNEARAIYYLKEYYAYGTTTFNASNCYFTNIENKTGAIVSIRNAGDSYLDTNVKDCHFKGCTLSDKSGIAANIEYVTDGDCLDFRITGCSFDQESTVYSPNSAIFVAAPKAKLNNLEINNCSFFNFKSYSGVIFLLTYDFKSSLFPVFNCTFINNKRWDESRKNFPSLIFWQTYDTSEPAFNSKNAIMEYNTLDRNNDKPFILCSPGPGNT